MKKILLILVGGTICTAINNEGNLAVSDKAGVLLKQNYLTSDSPCVKDVEIESTENLYILSENMTVDRWNEIIAVYRKYTAEKGYDGIIMAHGTDALAYSSALFSLLLSATKVPVFLVSANENLLSDRTNGNANFRCAVECICRGIAPNVYVPYRNISDGEMYLHLGSRLRQCENYSEDFHSVGEMNITHMSEDNYREYFTSMEQSFPQEQRKTVVDITGNWKLKNCVLKLMPYVGMDYSAYDYSRFAAVLHGTFHSGTVCVELSEKCDKYDRNSMLYLLDNCFGGEKPVDVYVSPSRLVRGMYETVSILGTHTVNENSVRFMYGYTNEMAYAKLVIAYSLFETETDRQALIHNEYNFEMITK